MRRSEIDSAGHVPACVFRESISFLGAVARYAAFGFRLDCDFDLLELAQARESSAPVRHVETPHAVVANDRTRWTGQRR